MPAAGVRAGDATPEQQTLNVRGSRLALQFAPGFGPAQQAHAVAWVRRSAEAVVDYFGRFPVDEVELLLRSVEGQGVRSGTTYAEPSLFVRVTVGRETQPAQWRSDWVMVHEMIHLAVPRVHRAHNWLHEGLATYVEGVARCRAGLQAPEVLWREWIEGMVHGLPQAGDRGLDHTPTWGRTYWGGALFCLLADLRIRQRSQRRVGLQQALRGVLAAGGNYAAAWPIARLLATADTAVDQRTLSELYEAMKNTPVAVDLPALWRDLGVVGGVAQEHAPMAAERRAILQS